MITTPDNILAYLTANCDTALFVAKYGRIQDRPAYRTGIWWTGDEDLDWNPEFHDVGGDGVADTDDAGEGDGIPTNGEPNFDRTDLNESDQIGLTGFKLNRIRAGIFSESERDLLLAFANQAAVSIENARLFSSLKRTLEEVTELKNLMDDVFASIVSGVITADV